MKNKRKTRNVWRLKLFAFFMIAFLSFLAQPLLSQTKVITGVVTEKSTKNPIIGATILNKKSKVGTITDIDGRFKISVHDKDSLVISYVGFKDEKIIVGASTIYNIKLEESSLALSEVVVVGYGVQKKKEITGAVTQVKSEELMRTASSDFTKSLQGQVSGVNVSESSGRPGDQANIQIRGLGSLSSNVSPLYVVDGIPYDSNPNIPAEEITSVDILKDGASAAIYGTRASNGVILITTKRGKDGVMKVGFTSYFGIQNITSGTPLLNTKEYLYVDEMMQRAQNGTSSVLYFNPNAMDNNTNFINEIKNNNAMMQNYNVSLSGGNKSLTYNINSNYFNQDGILINSGYDRFSTRANATLKKGKFEAFTSIGIMSSNKLTEPWALYEFAVFQKPYSPPIGNLNSTSESVIIPGQNPDHLGYLSRTLAQKNEAKENSYNLSTNLKYEITKNLTFQTNLGQSHYENAQKFWIPKYLVYNTEGVLNQLGSVQNASLQESYSSRDKLTMEFLLNYNKTFGMHTIGAVAGYTVENSTYKTTSVQKQDFVDNSVQVFDGGKTLTSITGNESAHGITGKLFRLQYNYASRYMLSASLRNDGSSNFGASHRYATFPGVSVGWNINEEKFMSSFSSIDNLKLRVSYGEVGNEGIPQYLYSAYIDPNIDYVWGPESSDQLVAGAIQRGYANPDVKWETNISRNIGLDLLMFSGKFSLSADVYQNDKKDMLLRVLLPSSTGTYISNNVIYDWENRYNSTMINAGNMVNKGLEIASSYKSRTKFGLGWQVSGTFTKNINSISDLGQNLTQIALSDSKPSVWRASFQDITTYMKPGYEAGAFFLIPTDGIIKTQEVLNQVKTYMPNAQLGDLKYIDAITVDSDGDGIPDKGDGKIDDNDRVYCGSGMSKFEAGLSMNLEFKGFDLNLQLYGSYGNKVYNGSKMFSYGAGTNKDLYYMWTPQNPNSDIMAARTNMEHDNFRSRSNYWLEDGSYIRVRNLSLGYTVPKRIIKKVFDNLRVYVTGDNIFTLTKYEGYDPEVGGNGISTRGIDRGNYPISRKFLFGVQVDF